MDRRRRRMERTKAALLEAGITIFFERGIHLTRIEDITERADVAKGSFYNYFESKDAFVAEILDEAVHLLDERYLQPLQPVGTITARLGELMGAHQAFVDDFPEYALVLHQARGILQLRSTTNERLKTAILAYLECLGHYLPLPDGSSEPAAGVRLQLAVLLAGIVTGPRSFALAADLPYDVALTREATCRGLAAVLSDLVSTSSNG